MLDLALNDEVQHIDGVRMRASQEGHLQLEKYLEVQIIHNPSPQILPVIEIYCDNYTDLK